MQVPQLLLGTLNDLLEENFKLFKWNLSMKVLENLAPIPRAVTQHLSRFETVAEMTSCYGEDSAVKVTVAILRIMNFHGSAQELEEKYAAAVPPAPAPPAAPAPAPPAAPVTVYLAQHGGMNIAPTVSNSSAGAWNITINKPADDPPK